MNLFINALLSKWKLILFDSNSSILLEKDIEILLNESEKLIWLVNDFLESSKVNYNDLENIVVVAGPWSFTWIRTISLLVNTINFVTKNNLTAISFFDLYNSYPIIKSSSKRDSFIKKSLNSEIEIIKNDDLLSYLNTEKVDKIYWEFDNIKQSLDDSIQTFEKINYSDIIKNIEFDTEKLIEPIYIKKPSIW